MKLFFIISLGRSGSKFLADLLDCAPCSLVYHEPYTDDKMFFGLRYYYSADIVMNNYLEERFKKLLPANDYITHYGEVNSYLRYEIDWLKKRFNPTLIHMIRDGRDFVRSALKRDTYTAFDKQVQIVPRDGDTYSVKWYAMDRFQKLSWYWMHSNEYISSKVDRFVRFEQYFHFLLQNWQVLAQWLQMLRLF